MKWFLGTYTNRFQHRHNFPKRLFSGRYKSVIIDAGVPGHLRLTCDYVHLNPARAKCLRPKQSLQAFRWSSYPAYLKPPTQRPAWLHVDWLLTEMGIAKDSEAGRRQFASQMEQRRQEAVDSQWKPLRRGWYLGDKKFRRLLLDTARAKLGPIRSGLDPQKAAEEKKARRILREEMARLKWNQAELNRRRKGDAQKMRIAERIRAQSTVTTRWLAENLKMGAVTSVSSRLYHAKAHPTTR
jgi:hypothetical protein